MRKYVSTGGLYYFSLNELRKVLSRDNKYDVKEEEERIRFTLYHLSFGMRPAALLSKIRDEREGKRERE